MRNPLRRRRPSVPLALELGLLLVTVAAAAGLARLTTAPFALRAAGPVLACAVAGHVVVALVQRVAPTLLALVAGTVAVVVVCSWIFVPGATAAGFPAPASLHELAHLLRAAGMLIRSQATPIPATPGVRLWLAAGAGAVAVVGRALLGWRYGGRIDAALVTPLIAPTAAFAYTSLLSSEVDRVQGAAVFVAAVVVYGLVADRPWLAGRSAGRVTAPRRPMAKPVPFATLLTVAVVVVVPVLVSPAFAGMVVDAVPFTSTSATGGSSGAGLDGLEVIDAKDLIDNLRAVLVGRADQVLFAARTSTPTYWQVATLTQFDGVEWTPDPATARAADSDGPAVGPFEPALPLPSGAATFEVSVALGGLRTPLLPVPPGALSVTGTIPVTVIPTVGASVTPPATPGFDYVAQADVAPLSISGGRPDAPAESLAPYLMLPREPQQVVSLARSIVRGAPSASAEALDLVKFFDSARFHYSLAAPAPTSDPLTSFLFHTRTGFCQQFAGAFGVLAREVGLPTRLAVGFIPGTVERDGRYQVTGADAHVWPEVYLGPNLGWVSFEPTPSAGAPVGAPGVFTARSRVTVLVPQEPAGQIPVPLPTPGALGSGGPVRPSPATTLPTGLPPAPAASSHRSTGSAPWVPISVALLVVVCVAVASRRIWARLVRRARARLAPPRSAVLAAWRDAADALDRRHLGRRQSETVDEHARRVRAHVSAAGASYEQLARLAERASYSPDPPTPQDVAAARRLRAAVCSELSRRRRRRTAVGERPLPAGR